jgi:hypothetical protein
MIPNKTRIPYKLLNISSLFTVIYGGTASSFGKCMII